MQWTLVFPNLPIRNSLHAHHETLATSDEAWLETQPSKRYIEMVIISAIDTYSSYL